MNNEAKYNISEKFVIYIIAVLAGIVFIAVSLLVSAGICLAADITENNSSVISGVCAGVGAFISGFLASKKIRTGGILNGMACGGLIYLIIFVLSLFISENGFSLITLYHALITVLSASIGGVIGVNSAQKRKII